ncbi:MAG: OFA family MFS transporter [Planctomycetota bacterium]|nr:OFA family MFS transporter [Planctomycetota bacterium]
MGRGWVVTLSGMGINLALGILYTWSVISKAIPAEWGWTEEDKSAPFSYACLIFSFMMIPAGRLQDKLSPRLVATIGGLLVGAGMILASQADTYFSYVLGFGVLAGTGFAFGYASATPPAVKWFPAKRTGMIAGIVVSGFGLASVYAAPLATWLIATQGVPRTMWILGLAFLVVVVALSQLLRIPPKGYVPPGTAAPTQGIVAKRENFSPVEMLSTVQFYLLWFMYFCGSGAGLMVIAKLAPLAKTQVGITHGFILVAWLAVGNGAGRIITGTLSDRLGRKPTIIGCLLFQAVLMVVLTFATTGSVLGTIPAMALLSALIGANYGANLAIYPSITKDFYGLKNFGVNYGLLFTAWGVGGYALSKLLAGKLFDAYHSYIVSCYVAAGLLVVAAVVALLLQPPKAERST